MAQAQQEDFRKLLNFMLEIYYRHKGVVIIHKEVADARLPIHVADLSASFTILLADDYIKEVAKGYSSVLVGCITGKGRVFFEKGGYRDETTRVDRIIR